MNFVDILLYREKIITKRKRFRKIIQELCRAIKVIFPDRTKNAQNRQNLIEFCLLKYHEPACDM